MNKCLLIGNLTVEPTKLETAELVRFTIAVNASYTKADGTRPTEFFNIVTWRELGLNCLKHLHKGSKVSVAGKIHNAVYEKDGVKQYKTEIVADEVEFLSPKPTTTTKDAIFEIDDSECPF